MIESLHDPPQSSHISSNLCLYRRLVWIDDTGSTILIGSQKMSIQHAGALSGAAVCEPPVTRGKPADQVQTIVRQTMRQINAWTEENEVIKKLQPDMWRNLEWYKVNERFKELRATINHIHQTGEALQSDIDRYKYDDELACGKVNSLLKKTLMLEDQIKAKTPRCSTKEPDVLLDMVKEVIAQQPSIILELYKDSESGSLALQEVEEDYQDLANQLADLQRTALSIEDRVSIRVKTDLNSQLTQAYMASLSLVPELVQSVIEESEAERTLAQREINEKAQRLEEAESSAKSLRAELKESARQSKVKEGSLRRELKESQSLERILSMQVSYLESLVTDSNKARSTLEDKYKDVSHVEREHKETVQELEEEHVRDAKALRQQLEREHSENVKRLQDQHSIVTAELHETYREEVSKLKVAHMRELRVLQDNADTAQAKAIEELQNVVRGVEAKQTRTVQDLKDQYGSRIEDLGQAHATAAQNLKTGHDTALADIRLSHQGQVLKLLTIVANLAFAYENSSPSLNADLVDEMISLSIKKWDYEHEGEIHAQDITGLPWIKFGGIFEKRPAHECNAVRIIRFWASTYMHRPHYGLANVLLQPEVPLQALLTGLRWIIQATYHMVDMIQQVDPVNPTVSIGEQTPINTIHYADCSPTVKPLLLTLQCVIYIHCISSSAKITTDPMPPKLLTTLSSWTKEWLKHHTCFCVAGFQRHVDRLMDGTMAETSHDTVKAAFPSDCILNAVNSDISADMSLYCDSMSGLLCIFEVSDTGTEVMHVCEITDIAAVKVLNASLTLQFNHSVGLSEERRSLQIRGVGGTKIAPVRWIGNLPDELIVQ